MRRGSVSQGAGGDYQDRAAGQGTEHRCPNAVALLSDCQQVGSDHDQGGSRDGIYARLAFAHLAPPGGGRERLVLMCECWGVCVVLGDGGHG